MQDSLSFHLLSTWVSFPFHEFGIIRVLPRSFKRRKKKSCSLPVREKYIADLGNKGLQLYQSSQRVARVANSAIREPKYTERLFLISLLSIINRKPTENKK